MFLVWNLRGSQPYATTPIARPAIRGFSIGASTLDNPLRGHSVSLPGYMVLMLWRNSRGRPSNKPAGFILPCRPTVAARPPSGAGWVHELKHDGYRLQVHVHEGRVRLYTMNGAGWSKRYPRIFAEAARIKGHAIIDAEVVCLDRKGVAQFDLLHNRSNDAGALALGFDLLALNGKDLRKRPLVERKTALSKLLIRSKGGSDGAPLTFAGLWDEWMDIETGRLLKSCTVIVTNANAMAAKVHNRMPVLLQPQDFDNWLSGKAGAELLKAAADDHLQTWPVSRRVNSSRTPGDDPALIEQVAA